MSGNNVTAEASRLELIASASRYGLGANRAMVEYSFEVFRRHIVPGSILEMGPAEGFMTDLLATLPGDLFVVEGSGTFCDQIRKRHPKATVTNALFEEYEPPRKFENILLGHVLEHVEQPVEILRRVSGWLSANGRVIAAVPNARSIHRQAAVMMGLLPFEEGLNEADIHHGHRRVYNPETFRRDFNEAGLRIDFFGGYWLKPVSNSQIERDWTSQMLRAFMQLGERYPDIAAENFIVASA